MSVKERLHCIIEELSDSDLAVVERMLTGLRPPAEPVETTEERRARVYALAGSAAGLPGSVDEFLARKHADKIREDERDRRRHAVVP